MAKKNNNGDVQINEFLKGMIQDLDINKTPADRYLTAWDIKLVDKEGQGFVLTNNDGTKIAFTITQFFEGEKHVIPLGWCQHKDIIYIASCADDDLGYGEIGCFPSPLSDDGGFEAVYKPLHNFTDGPGGYLRTELFKFDTEHMLDMIPKDHYDGSIDIYFADGKNPLRVMNTGFTQDGKTNGIKYNEDTFETNVNLVLSSKTILQITDFTVTSGGSWKYGNYIFFFKYATEDFNESHFVAEYGPIPIYKGANLNSSVMGGDASDNSDKMITFNITNIDTSYAYIKIGFLRWFSSYNGSVISEFGEVNDRFHIEGSTITISVSGTEGQVFLQETEAMLTKSVDIIPSSIAQLNNRLWGSDWKRTSTHNNSLSRFAKLIKIGFDDLKTVNDQHWDASILYGQYKDYNNYDYVGYFRGEPYVFGIVAELNDGTMTQAYPLNGVDMFSDITPDWTENSVDKGNYEGIFRFPNARLSAPINSSLIHIMGVKFIAQAAFESIMSANENNWIRFNVRAIYFVRGDRYPILKSQGLMMHSCHPGTLTVDYPLTKYCSVDAKEINTGQATVNGGYDYNQRRGNTFIQDNFWGSTATTTNNWTNTYAAMHIPVFRGYMPMCYREDHIAPDAYLWSYVSRFFSIPDKYCFYSPDMLFKESNDVDDYNYIWRVGKTINPRPGATNDNEGNWIYEFLGGNPAEVRPFHMSYMTPAGYINQTARAASIDTKVMVGEKGFIKPANSGFGDFVNAIDEPFESIDNAIWDADDLTDPTEPNHTYFARSSIFAKYLGISLDNVDKSGGTLNDEDFNLDIVNIYKSDPTSIDIRNLFANILSIQYKKISQGINIADVVTAIVAGSWNQYKNIVCYKGDCFVQRTYFKQRYWKGSAYWYSVGNVKWDDPLEYDSIIWHLRNSHGLILGIVTENSTNTAMRSEYELNSFFPNTEATIFAPLPYNSDNIESFRMNNGYSKTLSTNVFMMKDPDIPEKSLQYTARIKWSDVHVPGSFVDGYRTFRTNNYKDFDTNNGRIIKLAVVYDRLVSVQENAIIEHYVDERLTTPMSDATAGILGQGDTLSSNFRKMSNYGSQHKQSVIEADALFGVDWKRNIIWECSLQRSAGGPLYLDVKDISKEQMIEKWMRELSITINNGLTDKINNYRDIIMKGEGINSGFDLNTGDIYFTFHKRVESI